MRAQAAAVILASFVPLSCLADLAEDFLAAIRKGDAERVKALLAQGADVNAKSPYGATGLFFAADRGNVAMIKILLDHGADVNVKDTFYGATALTCAAEKQRVEVIRLLLDKGATAGADDVLMGGVQQANAEMVKAILEHKNAVKPEELSDALSSAEKNKKTEIAELLRKAGVTPPPKPDFQVDPETLKSYAGSYTDGSLQIKFEVAGGKLSGGAVGQKAVEWEPVGPGAFQHPEFRQFKITFTVENGRVVSLSVPQQNGSPMVFKKEAAQ